MGVPRAAQAAAAHSADPEADQNFVEADSLLGRRLRAQGHQEKGRPKAAFAESNAALRQPSDQKLCLMPTSAPFELLPRVRTDPVVETE
jgi:hypothetical protein